MPKATRTSRSKKVDTPLRQRKFAVPEKQVLEKVVTQDEEISVSLNYFSSDILFLQLKCQS
jgi:hypothetical protein